MFHQIQRFLPLSPRYRYDYSYDYATVTIFNGKLGDNGRNAVSENLATLLMVLCNSKKDLKQNLHSKDKEIRDKLLNNVKKEVKKLMEESVTKKFIHEDSSCVLSLCASIEECLLYGLKKRTIGLFKTNTSMALLIKISKQNEYANQIIKLCSSSSPSLTSCCNNNYLWIKLALLNKTLGKILDYIISTSDKYYLKTSLINNPVDSVLLSSLLVGPCALEYTKIKTQDYLWIDQRADELVKRYRMHSHSSSNDSFNLSSPTTTSTSTTASTFANTATPKLAKYPLVIQRYKSQSTTCASSPIINDELINNNSPSSLSIKDYVESLHQNSKSKIIYAKNNVLVYTKNKNINPLPGYLSLHLINNLNLNNLILKWTPNKLMNSSFDSINYWNYALNINLNEIVYIHCHLNNNLKLINIILIAQDGIQYSPICLPINQNQNNNYLNNLFQFLNSIDSALKPNGYLDPPLCINNLTGNIYPKIIDNDNDNNVDFVFRIINSNVDDYLNSKSSIY